MTKDLDKMRENNLMTARELADFELRVISKPEQDRIDQEIREWLASFRKLKDEMQRVTEDDLRIIVR